MRGERFDVRPGEVDVEEKKENSKAGYGRLLRAKGSVRGGGVKEGGCIRQARRRRGRDG